MNLESFDTNPPWDARRIVLHEFGHAIGLVHEHQRRGTRCNFRCFGDQGYVKKFQNNSGFLVENQGRSPGVIAYFQEKPFNWSCAQIISNISTQAAHLEGDGSKYDPSSIMHYTFPRYLLTDENCADTQRPVNQLSPTDISVVRRNYPFY
jgi:serralysin